MFESTVTTGQRDFAARCLMFLTSAAIHGIVVVALVLLPLVFFNALPAAQLLTILLAAPALPPAPPPPMPPGNPPKLSTAATRIPRTDFMAPDRIPRGIAAIDPPPFESINPGNALGLPDGVQGGWPGVPPGEAIGPALAPPPQALPPPPRPAPRREPIRMSSGVQESKLIYRVDPEYPPLARRARVSGTVILMVTVNEEGEVADVKVMRGHPLLDEEALRAVRQWRYSPTLLNGEPVPVIAMVTVIFSLK